TAAAETTAAAFTGSLGASLRNIQGATIHLLAVELFDRIGGFLFGRHFDEAEAFAAARIAIHDYLGGLYRAHLRKVLLKRAIGSGIRKVTYIQFLAHDYFYLLQGSSQEY